MKKREIMEEKKKEERMKIKERNIVKQKENKARMRRVMHNKKET